MWGGAADLADLPPILVERLRHYFLTYKLIPGEAAVITVQASYGRDHAAAVVGAALADYRVLRGGADPPSTPA